MSRHTHQIDGLVLLSTTRGDWLACVEGDLPDDGDYETFSDWVRAFSADYDHRTDIRRGPVRQIAGITFALVEVQS